MSRPNTKLIKELYLDVEGARDLGEDHRPPFSIAKARRLLRRSPYRLLGHRPRTAGATPERLEHGGRTDARLKPATSPQKSRWVPRGSAGTRRSTRWSADRLLVLARALVLVDSIGVDVRHYAVGVAAEAAQLLWGQDVDDE